DGAHGRRASGRAGAARRSRRALLGTSAAARRAGRRHRAAGTDEQRRIDRGDHWSGRRRGLQRRTRSSGSGSRRCTRTADPAAAAVHGPCGHVGDVPRNDSDRGRVHPHRRRSGIPRAARRDRSGGDGPGRTGRRAPRLSAVGGRRTRKAGAPPLPLPRGSQRRAGPTRHRCLAAARLITIDAATVEVTHEALFANWPRLANRLEEDEQGRRLRAHLAPAAQEWDQTGRPDVDLYSGVRLDAALDWAGEHSTDLNPVERRFLQASQARADRELQTERARATREARGRRRLRVLLIAVAGAAVVAIAATAVALVQRRNAEQQRLTATEQARLAVARQLGAAALAHQPLDRSLLLAVTAAQMDNDVQTRSDLLTALQRAPAAKSVWTGADEPLYGLVESNDHIAVAAGFKNLEVWDLTGPRTHLRNQGVGYKQANELSGVPVLAARPRTEQVAVGNIESFPMDTQRSSIQLWDFRRQQSIGLDAPGSNLRLSSLSWSTDGRWLAAAQTAGDVLAWTVADLSRPPMHIKRVHPIAATHNPGFPATYSTFPAVACAGGDKFVIVEASGHAQISRLGSPQPERTFFVETD